MGIWFDSAINRGNIYGIEYFKSVLNHGIGTVSVGANGGKSFFYNGFLVAIDGKLDNLKFISNLLEISTENDAEIIISLYQTYGLKGLFLLQGAATVILYDSDKNTTFLFRCFMHGFPLYFVSKNKRLSICTNPLNLLRRDDVSFNLNAAQMANIFAAQIYEFRDTAFEEIEEVSHGELVIIDNLQNIRREKQPLSENFYVNKQIACDKKAIQGFKKCLCESVSKEIRDGKKYGIMLSSGMDSSMIAYFASKYIKEIGGELIAYSWGLPGNSGDESNNIKLLCKELDIPLRMFDGTLMGAFDQMDYIPLTPDSSMTSIFWQLHQKVYQLAQKDGIEYMFAGGYGDMLYRGDRNSMFKEIWRDRRFDIFWEIIKDRGIRGIAGELKRSFMHSNLYFTPSLDYLQDELKSCIDKNRYMKNGFFENIRLTLIPAFMVGLHRGNYLSSIYEIKVLDPYLNKELLNYTQNIPIYLTYRHNLTKYFSREAMKGLLPEEIRIQPRVGLIGTLSKKSFYRNIEKVKEKIWKDVSWNQYVKEEWMRGKLQKGIKVDNYDLHVIWNCITLSAWIKAIKPGGSLYEDTLKIQK